MNENMPEELTDDEVWGRSIRAVMSLLDHDLFLLSIDINERSISHRLGLYLANEFPKWDVDCEYNRCLTQKKVLTSYKRLLEKNGLEYKGELDDNAEIFPDIIVHCRDTPINLIALEIKLSSNRENRLYDTLKLQSIREELGYMYTIFLDLGVDKRAGQVIICEGHRLNSYKTNLF